MDDIKKFTTETVQELDKLKGVQIERAKLGPCPICGREITENRKGYSCWSREDPGCGFVIWKKKAGKNLPVSVAKELIESLRDSPRARRGPRRGPHREAGDRLPLAAPAAPSARSSGSSRPTRASGASSSTRTGRRSPRPASPRRSAPRPRPAPARPGSRRAAPRRSAAEASRRRRARRARRQRRRPERRAPATDRRLRYDRRALGHLSVAAVRAAPRRARPGLDRTYLR